MQHFLCHMCFLLSFEKDTFCRNNWLIVPKNNNELGSKHKLEKLTARQQQVTSIIGKWNVACKGRNLETPHSIDFNAIIEVCWMNCRVFVQIDLNWLTKRKREKLLDVLLCEPTTLPKLQCKRRDTFTLCFNILSNFNIKLAVFIHEKDLWAEND